MTAITDLRTTPFWRDDHPWSEVPLRPVPTRTDVAIVGAGYTGLNAAIELAQSGVSVTVLDAGTVGAGASSVNGGMVNPGLKRSTQRIFAKYGPTLGREFWDLAYRSLDLVAQRVEAHGIECAYVRSGAAVMGSTGRDRANFGRQSEWLADNVDFTTEVLGPDRVGEVIASPRFSSAMVDSVGAGLHPARYVDGLARAASGAGAVICERTAVTDLARSTDRYALETTRGRLAADTVIVATNGYTGARPLPGLRRRVIPVGSYIVVTPPLGAERAERLIPGGRMLWTARRFLHYFRRTPDDRLLLGGRNNLSTGLDLHESARILSGELGRIFPELTGVSPTHSWTGRLGVTFDLMPHIGRIDGVWYGLGYCGHGVGIATLLGTDVGRLVAGSLDRSPFQEIPHPTRPYYRGQPWFLPFAARWYRFLDAIGR